MDYDFAGRRVLVTGAGAGIGRDLVARLVGLNAQVIAVGQTQSKLDSLADELGGRLTTVCVDLADWSAVRSKLGEICKEVDFLVNNAGYSFDCAVQNDLPESQVDKVYAINLKAPINLISMVSEGMKARKFGAIVNVSSVASIAALDNHLMYASSKAALDMVTKVSAKELGPYNVRVNSVNPTVVWTNMSREYWSEPTRKTTMLSKIPMSRFVEVSEVVEPIIYLLSDKASMVSGITMPIDGGFVAT